MWICDFDVCVLLSHVRLFVTPWTVALSAPLSMEFSRQEYWSGLPFPLQGIFPTQGSNPSLLALAGRLFTIRTTREDPDIVKLLSMWSCSVNYAY